MNNASKTYCQQLCQRSHLICHISGRILDERYRKATASWQCERSKSRFTGEPWSSGLDLGSLIQHHHATCLVLASNLGHSVIPIEKIIRDDRAPLKYGVEEVQTGLNRFGSRSQTVF
jgi:hypothetical protein